MLKNRHFLLVVLVLISWPCFASDSTRILSKDDFISIVKLYHPVARQATIQVDKANAEILKARGAFDPMLNTDLDRKTMDGKLYYSYFKPELQIPTWYGVELKAGVEEIIGDRVTSEATMGKTSFVGVKVAANGLLFDKRRAVLRQAQAFRQQTEAERRLAINNLLFDALATYWTWVREYQNYRIITNLVKVNEARLGFVELEYVQGNRAAIDTIEALAQLQSFYQMQNSAQLAYMNAGLELSNYLWLDNNNPVDWNPAIVPDTADVGSNIPQATYPGLGTFVETANNHPKLQAILYKMEGLELEKKLKAQYLLPKLSVSTNMLSKGYNMPRVYDMPMLENNYKLGVDFSMPLFLRDARGGYEAAKLKIRETSLEQSQTALVIENKVKSYYNEVVALQQQVAIFSQAYDNYQKLYNGERKRFDIGESSLFLLNSRENKLLETSQKLIDLKTKWHKTYAGLLWAAGELM